MNSAVSQCYTEVRGEYKPINVTPTGIKCLVCKQAFPPDQLQSHLTTHINPSYQKPNTTAQKPDLKLTSLEKEEPDQQEQQSIWVKSFNPQQMPRHQQVKRKAFQPPTNLQPTFDAPPIISDQFLQPDTNTYINNYIDLGDEQGHNSQTQEQLQINQNIFFPTTKEKIQNKAIHFYKNDNRFQSNLADRKKIFDKKKPISSQAEDGDGYSVIKLSQKEAEVKQQESKNKEEKKIDNRQSYMINTKKKQPISALRISTISSKRKEQVEERSQREDHDDRTRLHPTDRAHKHNECPGCGGFYCGHCKSSVPPIYRPIPDEEGNYHFHPQGSHEQAVEFYREHYYKGSPGVCTGCQRFNPLKNSDNNYANTLLGSKSKGFDQSRRTDIEQTPNKSQR